MPPFESSLSQVPNFDGFQARRIETPRKDVRALVDGHPVKSVPKTDVGPDKSEGGVWRHGYTALGARVGCLIRDREATVSP
jgi:hypothetical protein